MNSILLPMGALFVAVMLTFSVFIFFIFIVRLDEDGELLIFALRGIQAILFGLVIFIMLNQILRGEF